MIYNVMFIPKPTCPLQPLCHQCCQKLSLSTDAFCKRVTNRYLFAICNTLQTASMDGAKIDLVGTFVTMWRKRIFKRLVNRLCKKYHPIGSIAKKPWCSHYFGMEMVNSDPNGWQFQTRKWDHQGYTQQLAHETETLACGESGKRQFLHKRSSRKEHLLVKEKWNKRRGVSKEQLSTMLLMCCLIQWFLLFMICFVMSSMERGCFISVSISFFLHLRTIPNHQLLLFPQHCKSFLLLHVTVSFTHH